MEALAALSVAAAVIQFVDFGSRLVSKGQELYRSTDGALAENIEIEQAESRLQALTEPLLASFQDEAISVICKACVDISKELVGRLDKLKVPSGHSHKRWKSFRQALKSVSSKEILKDLRLRLSSLRAELDTHIMLNIRDKVTNLAIQQDSRFSSVDKSTRDIMVAILGYPQKLREELDNQYQRFTNLENLEHGKTRAVLMEHMKTQLDTRVCQSILESLHFQTRTIRHETIPEAHKQTFEWIFRDPAREEKSWSHFGQWLETGQGIYWINGKAGSGKSTLMKFIVEHPKTKEMLDVWAEGSTVETPSYFFWASGSKDQQSQEGLLRSLLYDVLQKHHELVPTVFPDDWTKIAELASNNIPHILSTWSLGRLEWAFALLVSCSTLRICFFIDGLDECAGDHEELAEYFVKLACSNNVKLCLASRPWPAFLDTFRGRPGLRLQDLTRDDIERYVRDQVNGNTKMVILEQKEPGSMREFVLYLLRTSQGVFLWVGLVIKYLLNGLCKHSSLEGLRKRLYAMPPNLESLYSHMFSTIDSEDMEDGSKVFQLIRSSQFMPGGSSIELVYYALRADLSEALGSPVLVLEDNPELLHDHRFELICQEMEILLQTCCGGLIEIHCLEATDVGRKTGYLEYIHRTVTDFLKYEKIWSRVLAYTSQTNWDTRRAIMISSVMCLKDAIFLKTNARMLSKLHVNDRWYEILAQAVTTYELERISLEDIISLLDEFDRSCTHIALSYQWTQISGATCCHYWTKFIGISIMGTPVWYFENFLALAVESGLWFYVKHRLKIGPSLLSPLKCPLLARTFLTFHDNFHANQVTNFKTMEVLLASSEDPNEGFRGNTIWQYWVAMLHVLSKKKYESSSLKLTSYVRRGTILLLEAGADLNTRCIAGDTAWEDLYERRQVTSNSNNLIFPGLTIKDGPSHSLEFESRIAEFKDGHADYEQLGDELRKRGKLVTGNADYDVGQLHSLKSVIEDLRGVFLDGTDEILELIERLEIKEASEQPLVKRRKIVPS